MPSSDAAGGTGAGGRSGALSWVLAFAAIGMALVLVAGGFMLAATAAFFSSAKQCQGLATGSGGAGQFALVAELNPAGAGNWQSAVRDGQYWYVDEARDAAGEAVIHRLDSSGRELDQMVLAGGDHARSFAVVEGRVYHPFGDSIRVFTYRPGRTISRSQTKDTGWHGDFALDPSGRTAVIRNGGRYRAFDLATRKRIGGAEITISNAVRQGTGVQGTTLYVLTGAMNKPARIDSYSLITGRALGSVDVTAVGLEGTRGFREPEGMYGSQFGVKVYGGDRRRLRIYQLGASSGGARTPGGYSDPVTPATVGARFGATGSWARYHTGLDLRASSGQPERSVLAGTVLHAGPGGNAGGWAGNYVAVRHGNGWTTLYAHMSRVKVAAGQTVQAGDILGYAGQTGRAFGVHLHFETYPPGVRYGDVYSAVDPAPPLAAWKRQGSAASTGGPASESAASGAADSLSRPAAASHATGAAAARAAAARYFPAAEVDMAVAIAGAESGWNPTATNRNTNGSTDYGVWQINTVHGDLLTQGSWSNINDNAKMAYTVWREAGGSWTPWSTYNSGSYKKFLAAGSSTPSGSDPNSAVDDCSWPAAAVPADSSTGGVRTVTDPTSHLTYTIPIPTGPAGVAMNFALDQLGEPYQFGSQGPDSWDCSGLVSKAWKAAGVDVYPQTEQLVKDLPAVSTPRPGDLLYKPGHVQMFLMTLPSGQQLIVEAPRTGKDVRVVPQWMEVARTLRPGGQPAQGGT